MKAPPLLSFKGRILGRLLERPNRFLAIVDVGGKEVKAHVHDPGRLKELLFPGNEVAIIRKRGNRKTKYDLIGARRGEEWAFVHSGYHSEIAHLLISLRLIEDLRGYEVKRREVRVGKSRIDFLLHPEAYLEVKGCTLIEGGRALFPDAPTQRGRRHLIELQKLASRGKRTYVLFLVFGSAEKFSPNWKTDPNFSNELLKAEKMGVNIIAYSLLFDSIHLFPNGKIEVDIRGG